MQTGKQDKAFDNNHKTKLNWKKRETSYTEGLFKVLWFFFYYCAHAQKIIFKKRDYSNYPQGNCVFFKQKSLHTMLRLSFPVFSLLFESLSKFHEAPPVHIFISFFRYANIP